jgi:imidazolonepropionase
MLIHSASQLLTLNGGPQRGSQLGQLDIIEDGALVIQEGLITAIGKSTELHAKHAHEPMLDAKNCVVMPGFVDSHNAPGRQILS